MKPHERATTKVCSKCGVRKPLEAFYAKRKTKTCKVCELKASRKRWLENRERELERGKRYREANKAKIKAYMVKRYQETREEWLARCKAYRERPEVKERERERLARSYAANREAIQEARREFYRSNPDARARFDEYQERYYKENRHRFLARRNKRIAATLQAIPKWADLEAIRNIYKAAAEISAKTGIRHAVDHIVPLQGRMVCGLHVENNLQVIPEKENLKKFNKHIG